MNPPWRSTGRRVLRVLQPDASAVGDRAARVPDDREARVPTRGLLLGHLVVRHGPPAPVFGMWHGLPGEMRPAVGNAAPEYFLIP